jgi:hypothetical protein
MSKHNKRKQKGEGSVVLVQDEQVKCGFCGHVGHKTEYVVTDAGNDVPNWHCLPRVLSGSTEGIVPVCVPCAIKHDREFKQDKRFSVWFAKHDRLPFLAKTVEMEQLFLAQWLQQSERDLSYMAEFGIVAKYRTRSVPVKPEMSEVPKAEPKAVAVKVHPLDMIRANAQVVSPSLEIENPVPDDHVTCSLCGCEGTENEPVEVGKYGKKIEKFRSTPFNRNHPEVQPQPICFECWTKHHAKIREDHKWWFDFNDYLPAWTKTKEILAKHLVERQKQEKEADQYLDEFARRNNITADSERICTRCKKHHGQRSVVSEVPFIKKRITSVGWVLIQPKTKEELLGNLCCNDCLGPQEKAFKLRDVINTLGKKTTSRPIRPEYLPKSVKDGKDKSWGSAARAMDVKATGTYGK